MTKKSSAYGSHLDRSSVPGKSREVQNDQVLFVNYDLTDEERASCKRYLDSAEQWAAAVEAVVVAGYALSVKPEGDGEAFAAFLRAPSRDCDNSGLILSGRGSTPVKAVRQVLFKHLRVMAEDWRPYLVDRRRDIIDD